METGQHESKLSLPQGFLFFFKLRIAADISSKNTTTTRCRVVHLLCVVLVPGRQRQFSAQYKTKSVSNKLEQDLKVCRMLCGNTLEGSRGERVEQSGGCGHNRFLFWFLAVFTYEFCACLASLQHSSMSCFIFFSTHKMFVLEFKKKKTPPNL